MITNLWYVAERSTAVAATPVRSRLLGQNVVLFRDAAGAVHCLSDICVHRGGALSQGQVLGDCIECPYHGWQFRGDGKCVTIPAQPEVPAPGSPPADPVAD